MPFPVERVNSIREKIWCMGGGLSLCCRSCDGWCLLRPSSFALSTLLSSSTTSSLLHPPARHPELPVCKAERKRRRQSELRNHRRWSTYFLHFILGDPIPGGTHRIPCAFFFLEEREKFGFEVLLGTPWHRRGQRM